MSGSVSKSFASKILDKRGHYIYLVKGMENGKDAWLYVRVDRHNKEMFEYGLKKDIFDVNTHGKLLYSGWGENPPQDVVMALRHKYVDQATA